MPIRPNFVVDIEHDFPCRPAQGNMGDYYIDFRLGFCMDTDEAAAMSVVLAPGSSFSDDYEGYYDLGFGVRFLSLERSWKVSGLFFDRDTASSVVRLEDREVVLSHTLRAIWNLVRAVEPPNITMTTYYAELPPAALVKYSDIERLLPGLGYHTKDAYTDDEGKHR